MNSCAICPNSTTTFPPALPFLTVPLFSFPLFLPEIELLERRRHRPVLCNVLTKTISRQSLAIKTTLVSNQMEVSGTKKDSEICEIEDQEKK